MSENANAPMGAALVVGGGIAGVQAAIDLANAGIKVYLVERSPAIGGKMAQLDAGRKLKTHATVSFTSARAHASSLGEQGRIKNFDSQAPARAHYERKAPLASRRHNSSIDHLCGKQDGANDSRVIAQRCPPDS